MAIISCELAFIQMQCRFSHILMVLSPLKCTAKKGSSDSEFGLFFGFNRGTFSIEAGLITLVRGVTVSQCVPTSYFGVGETRDSRDMGYPSSWDARFFP